MTKPIVLVDLDGVVADLATPLHAYVQQAFNKPPVVVENGWSFEERYGIHRDDLQPWFYTQGTFLDLPVIPGATEGVARLAEVADVWFCSTPKGSKYCSQEKQQWVFENFPGFGKRLILTKDKTLVRGRFLIDDKPVVEGVMEPEWEHIWYDDRAFTWRDVEKLVIRLEE